MPVVSLTIPCYNEGSFIFKAVKEIQRVMDATPYTYEIILFDDKSRDKTAENIRKIAKQNKKVRAFFHQKNQGRGQTVKDAIMQSKGSIVGFIDIDLEVHARYIPSMVQAIEDGYDLVIAKRVGNVNYPLLYRHFLSNIYQFLVKLLLKISIADTEAGCKFFNKKKAMPVIRATKNKHWFWDTEVMARTCYSGLKVKEIPVVFEKNRESASTVKIFSDIPRYLKDLMRFRAEMRKEGKI